MDEAGQQAPSGHSVAMAAALARAPSRGGWLALPDLPVDYRGPAQRPHRPFGAAGLDRPILHSLAEVVARQPDATAFQDATGTLRFAALWRAIGRLAAAIRAVPGDAPVGLVLPSGVGAPVAILGCLAAGRVSLLLDAGHAPARNAALLERVGARLVVLPGALIASLPAGLAGVPLEAAFDPAIAAVPPDTGAIGLDAPAFIVCTSGSTGEPKMVVHGQRCMLHQVRMVIDGIHLSEHDRWLLLVPGANITALTSFLNTLSGCAIHLLPLNEVGIRELREALRRHPPTVLRAGPSLLRTLAQLPDATQMLASLRAVRISGEPLLRADEALLRRCLPPDCLLYNRYGSTELVGTWWIPRPEDDHDPLRTAAGIPDPGVEAMIVDAAGQPCTPGATGELWLRSRYAALGEWGADGLVPGRLEHDPADPALRIYRTGDLARLTPDGVIVVLGRMDRMVKVNGHRVELAEVETALRRSPEVRQAAVVARDAAGRVTLLAFVVPEPGAEPGLDLRLRRALRESLPSFMMPARIELLDALPLLSGGKLDESALLARG